MEYRGLGVSPGIAVGEAFIYEKNVISVLREHILPAELDMALARYDACRQQVQKELEAVRSIMYEDPESAAIFSAHIDILFDEDMDHEIRSMVETEFLSPGWAIQTVYVRYAHLLRNSQSAVISERAADLEDVCAQLLRCWEKQEEKPQTQPLKPVVLVTHELSPSDAALFEREKVLAVVTEVGGATSHSAILARCRGIPALFGVEGAVSHISNGQTVLVDARQGILIPRPDAEQADTARKAMLEEARLAEEIQREMAAEPCTIDGQRIQVGLNVFSDDTGHRKMLEYVDGIGLFRTEFLYLERDTLPSEEEQFRVYQSVLRDMGDRPVILRTLDVGGDKHLENLCLSKEENPALGVRGIRLCLENESLFVTQLRAALRASAYGHLWLMFPMVTGMEDIDAAKNVLDRVRGQLDEEGIPYGKDIKTGIMIETPSIALLADKVAEEVDFASIGTNDLTQYLCAVDRNNGAVAQYYQACHPAMLRLIRYVARAFEAAGKPLGVCGEMAADPASVKLLLGCGILRLSMTPDAVPWVKRMIRSLSLKEARQLTDTACGLASAYEVDRYLHGGGMK